MDELANISLSSKESSVKGENNDDDDDDDEDNAEEADETDEEDETTSDQQSDADKEEDDDSSSAVEEEEKLDDVASKQSDGSALDNVNSASLLFAKFSTSSVNLLSHLFDFSFGDSGTNDEVGYESFLHFMIRIRDFLSFLRLL